MVCKPGGRGVIFLCMNMKLWLITKFPWNQAVRGTAPSENGPNRSTQHVWVIGGATRSVAGRVKRHVGPHGVPSGRGVNSSPDATRKLSTRASIAMPTTRGGAKTSPARSPAPPPKKQKPDKVMPAFDKLDKDSLPPVAGSWYPGKGDYTQLDKDCLPPCAGKRRDASGKWI